MACFDLDLPFACCVFLGYGKESVNVYCATHYKLGTLGLKGGKRDGLPCVVMICVYKHTKWLNLCQNQTRFACQNRQNGTNTTALRTATVCANRFEREFFFFLFFPAVKSSNVSGRIRGGRGSGLGKGDSALTSLPRETNKRNGRHFAFHHHCCCCCCFEERVVKKEIH